MVGLGISEGLLDVAVMRTVWVLSLDGPGLMPERNSVWAPEFSRMVMLVGVFNVGTWLTKAIVSVSDVLEEAMPSLTDIVIVAVPNVFVRGAMVTVRLLLLPPKTMFVLGTRLVLE